MISQKLTGRRMAALLILPALWTGFAHAQQPTTPSISEEISKQTGIYQSQGQQVPDGYVIGRSLLSYAFTLSSSFSGSLADLGPTDRWLDIGAGEGQAVSDHVTAKYDALLYKGRERPTRRARAVALSIEDRRTAHWHQTVASVEANQMQYFFGKRLRQYALAELGRFQLITDVLGGFSYTEQMSQFMEKALSFLEVKGSFYTLLQDIQSEKGSNRPYYAGSPFLTEIARPDGSTMSVCAWLKSISCAQVTCEFKAGHTPPVEVYRIHKTCENVRVPPLAPIHFVAGTPPERRFQASSP